MPFSESGNFSPKTPEQEPRSEAKDKPFDIDLESVEILPEKPIEIPLHARKLPIELESGDRLGSNNVEVVFEGKLKELMLEAEELKDLPENDRITELLKLVRSKLTYPYQTIIDEVKSTNPELGEWLENNFGDRAKSFYGMNVNECLDKGFGDCKILSAAYLSAAQAAGMKGVFQQCGPGSLKNIKRPDTGQPIFKMAELDQDANFGHAWVDIQLASGEWVPVDASANMAGTTPELKQTFRQAKYKTHLGGALQMNNLPKGLTWTWKNPEIYSGEGEQDCTLEISISKKVSFGGKNPPKPELESFNGNLSFTIRPEENPKIMNLQLENR